MGKKFRVASYNIRKAVGLDWRRDPDRILSVLEDINADIIVLQEVDKRLPPRHHVLDNEAVIRRLGYTIAPLNLSPFSQGWHGNAVFFKNFVLKTSQRLEIPSLEPRGAVALSFLSSNHKPLDVIGVHLGLTKRMRIKQFQFLKTFIESREKDVPCIVCGDFNEWRTEKIILDVFGAEYQIISPGPTFHASNPKLSFDHFLYRGGLRVIDSRTHITPLSQRASDHIPISLDFEFSI